MADFIARWLPVFATVAILPIANMIAVAICEGFQSWFDRRCPDDLPQTAGAWLERQVEAGGYPGVKVIVSESSRSWYAPNQRVIHLAADTYYKRDPVYWAIAAHELGHARFAYRHPIAAPLINAIAVMRSLLAQIGIGLAFGNVMVAVPLIGSLAFACIVVAVALQVPAIVEEVYASSFAISLLGRSGAVSPDRMRAVATLLMLACGTYMTTFAAAVAMLVRWNLVDRVVGGGWTPSGGVTAFGYLVAALASVELLRAMYWRLRGFDKLPLVKLVANAAVIWIMWDGGHPWLAALAVVPLGYALAGLVMLPGVVVATSLYRLVRGVTGVHETVELAADRYRGRDAIKLGNRALENIATTRAGRLSRPRQIGELVCLLALPLVIAFWLA